MNCTLRILTIEGVVMIVSFFLRFLFWAAVILAALVVVFMVGVRIVRRFVHFPIPAFSARVIDNPLRRRIQPPAEVVEWIGIQKGMVVLEIGPGPGTFTVEAARKTEEGVVCAVDIQLSIIQRLCWSLRKKNITNVALYVASAYDLPFLDKIFDRIFMIAVVAEIPDRNKALHEMHRVLKEDGLLAVGEFLPDPDYPRRKTVIQWCTNAGFELVNSYGGILHYVLTFRKSEQ